MAININSADEALLKSGKNLCIRGLFGINVKRIFITESGEKIKAYCSSWWSNGSNYSSSFLKCN